jgi:IMP dehydrogenase
MTQKTSYEYSDIDLVSEEWSEISTRASIDTSVVFCGNTIKVPLIASPMADVVNPTVASQIMDSGGYAILDRFYSIEQQVLQYKQCPTNAGVAIGISENDLQRYDELEGVGANVFCLDVANGANHNVIDFLEKLKKRDKRIFEKYFIIGNFQSYKQYKELVKRVPRNIRIEAIRLFVAPGLACNTKNATGLYSPPVSTLLEFQNKKMSCQKIADGGIREPGDFCKAIGLGASMVMAGSIFSQCSDSAAKKKTDEAGNVYNVYRGSASKELQSVYRETCRYIEGGSVDLTISNMTVSELIKQYQEGLQSSMSYFNSNNIKEFQQKINFTLRH